MDYQTKTLDGFFKRLQKPLPITIIAINWLTFVAAGRDMIHGAFKLYSDRACHNARYDTTTDRQVSRVDPKTHVERKIHVRIITADSVFIGSPPSVQSVWMGGAARSRQVFLACHQSRRLPRPRL